MITPADTRNVAVDYVVGVVSDCGGSVPFHDLRGYIDRFYYFLGERDIGSDRRDSLVDAVLAHERVGFSNGFLYLKS